MTTLHNNRINTTEMYYLINMLILKKIPFQLEEDNGGYPHVYYPYRNYKCSVICNEYSYGREKGLLEIMGLLTDEEENYDSVKGYLTAEEVLERIEKDYKNHILISNEKGE